MNGLGSEKHRSGSSAVSYTPAQAALVALMFLGWQLVLGFALGSLLLRLSAEPGSARTALLGNPLLSLIGINLLAFVLTLLGEHFLKRWRWRDLGGWTFRPGLLGPLLLLLVAEKILSSELDNLLRAVRPMPPALGHYLGSLQAPGRTGLAAVALMLVAGLTEEVIFRGLLLGGLRRVRGARVALLVSAGLFALIHLNPWQFAHAFALGLILGWTFLRTRSLLLCIVLHGASNGLNLLTRQLPWAIRGFNAPHPPAAVWFQPWWFDLAGLAAVALAVALFHRLTAPAARARLADQTPGDAGN